MNVISEGKIEFLLREDPNVLAYRRYTHLDQILVLCNLTGKDTAVTLPAGWENAKILLANRESTAVSANMNLLPYDFVALIK